MIENIFAPEHRQPVATTYSPGARQARRRRDALDRWGKNPTSNGSTVCVDCGLLLEEQVMIGCVEGEWFHKNRETEPGDELPRPRS